MSVCSNLGLDRPGRLAVYARYVVLRACLRAKRAHQCALGIAELCFVCSARPTLELRARGSCCALFHPCTLALRARSRAPRSRGSAAPPRLRAARAARTPTPINCAHCSNGFLYLFGVKAVQPFGRQCGTRLRAHQCALGIANPHKFYPLSQSVFVPIWDSIARSFGRICWMCRALRGQRAHQCALWIADPHKFYPLSQ
jgi:hypothetical protein